MRRLFNIALILIISSLSVKSVYGHFDNKINKVNIDTTQYADTIYTLKTSQQCNIDNHVSTDIFKDYTKEEMRSRVVKDKIVTIKGSGGIETFTLYEVPIHKNPNFYLSSEDGVAVIRVEFDEYKPNYIGIYSDDDVGEIDTIEIEDTEGNTTVYKTFERKLFKGNTLNMPIFESGRSVIEILNSNDEVLILQYGDILFKSYKVKVNKA